MASWVLSLSRALYAVGGAAVSVAMYAVSSAAPCTDQEHVASEMAVTPAGAARPHSAGDGARWTVSFSEDPLFSAQPEWGFVHTAREGILTWLVYVCRVVTWGGTSDADVCHALSPGLPSAHWGVHDAACRSMIWYSLRIRAEVVFHVACCALLCVALYMAVHACAACVCNVCSVRHFVRRRRARHRTNAAIRLGSVSRLDYEVFRRKHGLDTDTDSSDA